MAIIRSLDNLAREHTERAVKTIADIMDDPLSEDRDRLNAAAQLLDRGHGKPLTATIALPMNRQQAAMLAAMSDDDLMQHIQGAQLPRLNQREPITIDQGPDPLLE